MINSNIRKLIIILLIIGIFILMISERPKISWEDYNYSFFKVCQLIGSGNNDNYEDAYKLGMYYYLIKKNDEKSIYWFKKAAVGNHVEAIRELIKYNLSVNTNESKDLIKKYIQQLKTIALENNKQEDLYFSDLNVD